jgi:hypothetical protein
MMLHLVGLHLDLLKVFRPPSRPSGKYCKYHKTNSHNTDECQYLKKNAREVSVVESPTVEECEICVNEVNSDYNNPNLVLLDSCAQVSVFSNPSLLTNITDAPPVVITGVNKGTAAVTTSQAGFLPGLEKVLIYFSPQVKRNILRFSQRHKHYPITWDHENS